MGAASSRRACNSANRAIDRSREQQPTGPVFNTVDPDTWPVLLSLEQVAAIWQRKPSGLAKSCQLGKFLPAPFQIHPYRWRVDAVKRRVFGERSLRRAG